MGTCGIERVLKVSTQSEYVIRTTEHDPSGLDQIPADTIEEFYAQVLFEGAELTTDRGLCLGGVVCKPVMPVYAAREFRRRFFLLGITGELPKLQTPEVKVLSPELGSRAGDRIRTGDVQLGKLAFYH